MLFEYNLVVKLWEHLEHISADFCEDPINITFTDIVLNLVHAKAGHLINLFVLLLRN